MISLCLSARADLKVVSGENAMVGSELRSVSSVFKLESLLQRTPEHGVWKTSLGFVIEVPGQTDRETVVCEISPKLRVVPARSDI